MSNQEVMEMIEKEIPDWKKWDFWFSGFYEYALNNISGDELEETLSELDSMKRVLIEKVEQN